MARAELTADEIVQTLRRSTLTTVIVEGRDDMTVYRWLEEPNLPTSIDVLPCQGRATLLEVFERRSEFGDLPCAFIADRDMWLFSSVPSGLDELVLTRGYSIENDLLCESCVTNLLSPTERSEYSSLCEPLATWFAYEIEQYLLGQPYCVNIHPNRLVPLGTTDLDSAALAPRTFQLPSEHLRQRIRDNFELEFRGKSLLLLYVRILSGASRQSKYSKLNILEMAAKLDSTPYARRLYDAVMTRISTGG